MKLKNWCFPGAAAVLLWMVCGCSSVENAHSQKRDMMFAWIGGNDRAAQQVIDVKLRDPAWYNTSVVHTGDELLWRLESGSLSFHTGDFKRCIGELRTAEDLIRDYDERARISLRDAGAETGMLFTNLNALPYRGYCRDRIMLAVFKSLAYLGQGDEPAFRAQLRRLRAEQKKVQEDYRAFFEAEKKAAQQGARQIEQAGRMTEAAAGCIQHPERTKSGEFSKGMKQVREAAKRGSGEFLNPAALFLSGLGSARDGRFDNARIDFQRLYEAMPQNLLVCRLYVSILQKCGRAVPPALKSVKPLDFPIERDCVCILYASGVSVSLTQAAVYFPIECAWPVCEFHPAQTGDAVVSMGGRSARTVPLADMDAVFAREFQERLPGIVNRIILSTLVKEGLYYGGLTAIFASGMSPGAKAIAGTATAVGGAVYRTMMNTADTRSWEILPKTVSLALLPMPADRQGVIRIEHGDGRDRLVRFPEGCRSAIVYVSAPGPQSIRCHILPMNF